MLYHMTVCPLNELLSNLVAGYIDRRFWCAAVLLDVPSPRIYSTYGAVVPHQSDWQENYNPTTNQLLATTKKQTTIII